MNRMLQEESKQLNEQIIILRKVYIIINMFNTYIYICIFVII